LLGPKHSLVHSLQRHRFPQISLRPFCMALQNRVLSCEPLETRQPQHTRTREVNVLFIIDQLCELGGAERILLRTVEHLPQYGFKPTVVTFAIDDQLGIRQSIGCPLNVLPLRRTYDFTALRAANNIRRLIRSQNIQITHTFHETSDLWGGMIAKMSGCPVLVSSRRDMGFQRRKKHRTGYRWLGRYFDEVQVVSEQVGQFCIEQDGLDPQRVVTIYNGVDLPERYEATPKSSLRRHFGLPVSGPLVVSVGHIRRIKGYDVFMRIAAKVLAQMPDAIFAVGGCDHEPAHMRELKQLAAQLGLESNFRFLGDVKDVRSLLRAADVFCLPSRSEGLSNALLEAMACELPCVASAVGGNPEVVVDGRTGFLFDSEAAESAATHILRLLCDLSTAQMMGAAGREVAAKHFTTEAMVIKLVDSYERLLSTRVSNV
jgi:glycosyltransferase involved in cell wall biosynthesis